MDRPLPIDVTSLQPALPHRPPMVWIDQVLEANATGGTCVVNLSREALYSIDSGQPFDFAPIEWLAQAYGYARAAFESATGVTSEVKRAYLAGVSTYELVKEIPAEGQLRVQVKLIREMAPLALIDGTVLDEDLGVIAKARLKLYFER